jgi:hypothetical protein
MSGSYIAAIRKGFQAVWSFEKLWLCFFPLLIEVIMVRTFSKAHTDENAGNDLVEIMTFETHG